MPVGDFPLKDKIVVVTGGGSGICLAFTKAAVAQGAKVLIGDLKLTDDAQKFVTDAKDVKFMECDVAKWRDLENLITVSEKEFGDVPDVYVPGAAVFEPEWSNFWDDSEKDGYAELAINVAHPIKLTRLAMRALAGKDKKGVVCCISSTAALLGVMAAPLYCATKGAIITFVRSMGMAEVDFGVKVVAICPGAVVTPLWTDRPAMMKTFGVEDKTTVTPEDIADTIIELIQEGKHSGGTVLKHDMPQLGGKQVVFPGAAEIDLSVLPEKMLEAMNRTIEPLREIMKGERGKG